MNRILLCVLAACAAMAAWPQAYDITIRGTIEGLSSGRLLLLAQTGENSVDTLGWADFTAPEFFLRGTAKEPVAAVIAVQGYAGGFSFLAEPGCEYTARLKDGDGFSIRGGRLNNAWTAFTAQVAARRAALDSLRRRYDGLKAQNKFRSASRVNDSIHLLQSQVGDETTAFLASHDDLIAAYNALNTAVAKQADADESAMLYERLGEGARGTVSARILKERVERLRLSETGRKAPDFTLNRLSDGQPLTLHEVKAKLKIIDFWASWCGPCRMNNPALRDIYADFHGKGLEIIGVSLDNRRGAWASAVEKDCLPWPQVSSLKGWKCDVARLYNVTSVPAIFILDADDNIIATNLRGEKLRVFIAERLE